MKSLILYVSLVVCVIAIPQRGGSCPCPDVICPKYGRDACECMNRAAQDCYRMWVQSRNPSCAQPTPLNCNGPTQRPPPTSTRSSPISGQSSLTTYYSVVPYRTTITTTLPGFGWPSPVTSYSYSMSTTTITLINPPGSSPNGQWTQGQPWPWNQQTWQSTPSHRTTTVTISVPKGSTRSTISVISSFPASSVTTTITITAGIPTQPIQPPPITPSTPQSIPWPPLSTTTLPWPPLSTTTLPWPPLSTTTLPWPPLSTTTVPWPPLSTTTVPWARSSDDPWSVPPKPPVDFTPGMPSEAQTSTSKPAPWRPPPVPTGSWTPVSDPTIPPTPIVTPQPTSTPTQVKPTSTTQSTTATLGPPPPLPPVPAKCGPGMAKCIDNTYCDPQPLCSIGEDCPGICLPILNTDYVNGTQPWEARRKVWQKLLDEGEFIMYRWAT